MQKQELDSSKIKILICCHKPCELPKDNIFLPIQVGAAISDVDLGMQRDDQVNCKPCDNISKKNKSYCELTAMYWAWKNIKQLYPDLEYIGLNHYRRYFSFDEKKLFCDTIFASQKEIGYYKIDYSRLKKVQKYMIIPCKKTYPYSLFVDYAISHVCEDMKAIKTIIHDISPDYDVAFSKVMEKNNKTSPCNMFVMKWCDFNDYCSWLFQVLEEAEQRINITLYNDIQKRIFGFIAERLFNVWILKKKMKVKEVPIKFFCENRNRLWIYHFLIRVRNYICFSLMKK